MSLPATGKRWEDAVSRLKSVWREGWAVLAFLVAADICVLWLKIFLTSPGGSLPLFRFAAIAMAVAVLPGLGLARAARLIPSSLSGKLAVVLGLSLSATAAVAFVAYEAGVYSRGFALGMISVFSLWGLSTLRTFSIRGTVEEIRSAWQCQGTVERIALLFFIVYFHNLLYDTAVLPFTFWDAIVSWDKWGCDMAERQALGSYSLGGYPQFVPTLYSVFYKLSGTCTASFPDEQLLLHGFLIVFPVLLLFSIISVCTHFRLPWALPALLVFSHGEFQRWVASGQIDIPVTAMTVFGWSMALGAFDKSWGFGRNDLFKGAILGVMLSAVGFAKGNGVPWLLFFATYLGFTALQGSQAWPRLRVLAVGTAVVVLVLAPFYSKQHWLSTHQATIDRDPRLHSFTMEVSRPSLFVTDVVVVRTHAANLAQGIASPFKEKGWRLLGGSFLLITLLFMRRRGNFYWLLAVCTVAIVWFRTASYDYRNLLTILPFLAVLFSVGIRGLPGFSRPRPPWWAALLQGGLVVLYTGSFLSAELRGLRLEPELAYWQRPAQSRLDLINNGWSLVRKIVDGSTVLNAGRYVYTAGPFYRHLADRGVYSIKPFTFERASRNDVMLRDQEPRREGFVPVSRLRGLGFSFIDLFEPEFAPSSWSAAEAAGVVTEMREGGTLVVSGKGTVVLDIEALKDARTNSSAVLSLVCEQASPADSLRLDQDSAHLTNFNTRMLSVWQENTLNFLYWLSRTDVTPTAPLRFQLVKKSDAPLVIRGVRVLLRQSPSPGTPGRNPG